MAAHIWEDLPYRGLPFDFVAVQISEIDTAMCTTRLAKIAVYVAPFVQIISAMQYICISMILKPRSGQSGARLGLQLANNLGIPMALLVPTQ